MATLRRGSEAVIKIRKKPIAPELVKEETQFTEKELQLIKMCETGDIDKVYQCLWNNSNVNARLPNIGTTPLSVACQNGHFSIASVLIEFGAIIRTNDDYHVSALHWAANSGCKKLVTMLFNKGRLGVKDLAKQDNFGSTPLHFASVRNLQDIVIELVEAGADPFLTNNDGRKPSDLTSSDTIRSFLLDEEAKIIRNKTKLAKKEQAIAEEALYGRKGLTASKKNSKEKEKTQLPKVVQKKLSTAEKETNESVPGSARSAQNSMKVNSKESSAANLNNSRDSIYSGGLKMKGSQEKVNLFVKPFSSTTNKP